MPFITEEIWQALPHDGDALMVQSYPEYCDALSFPEDETAFEMVMSAIKAVRSRRAEMNVPPSRKPHLLIVTDKKDAFESGTVYLSKLAFAGAVEITDADPESLDGMVSVVTDEAKLFMPMAELVDLEKERARLRKELDKANKELARLNGKLSNEKFLAKAPEQVVAAEREKVEKVQALIDNLTDGLEQLR